MKYIVENWDTEEVIEVFDTDAEREEWIDRFVIYDPISMKYLYHTFRGQFIQISCYETR